jgi:hypothetical protein
VHEEQLSPELGRLIDAAKSAATQAGVGGGKAEGVAVLVGSGKVFIGRSGDVHSGEDRSGNEGSAEDGPLRSCAVARAFSAAGGSQTEDVLAIALAATGGPSDSFIPCNDCKAYLAALHPDIPAVTKQLGRWIMTPVSYLCAEV